MNSMIKSFSLRLCFPLLLPLLLSAAPAGALTIPSDGSDGAFEPAGNIVVDLSLAATGSWDTPGSGSGVYDPEQWAVVFKFSSINIPSGVTVTFLNHPSRAPVIWLSQGDVVIDGTVSLNGAPGHDFNGLRGFSEPGPGGFRGGRGSDAQTPGAAGMGPGGPAYTSASPGGDSGAGSGAGHGAPGAAGSSGGAGAGSPGSAYGNPGVFPLIGGSGGAGSAMGDRGRGGGAGGGAILIATSQSILLNGQVRANGGGSPSGGGTTQTYAGGGSGGGIRLVADHISGNGTLLALGGAGGTGIAGRNGGNGAVGRIRVETFTNELVDLGNPAYSLGVAEETPRLFRQPETPMIRSVSLGGKTVPEDPRAELAFPNTDVSLPSAGPASLLIEASHVPLDSVLTVRVIRRTGIDETVLAEYAGGTFEDSTWTAEIDVADGFSTVQVLAGFPD